MDRQVLSNTDLAMLLHAASIELDRIGDLVLSGGPLSASERKNLRECGTDLAWAIRQLAPDDDG